MAPADGTPMIPENLGKTWMSQELQARRRATARLFTQEKTQEAGGITVTSHVVYEGGLEEMHELGLIDIEPQLDRILFRVVLPEDAADAGLLQRQYDSRMAILQQVIAVGPGCKKVWDAHDVPEEKRLKPGDFTWILSTVADRMTSRDKTVRYMTVKVEYVGSKIIRKPAAG